MEKTETARVVWTLTTVTPDVGKSVLELILLRSMKNERNKHLVEHSFVVVQRKALLYIFGFYLLGMTTRQHHTSSGSSSKYGDTSGSLTGDGEPNTANWGTLNALFERLGPLR